MANHKWKDESFSKYQRQELCLNCGVYRDWLGGDFQCWKYWWPRANEFEMVKKQFERPDCTKQIKE